MGTHSAVAIKRNGKIRSWERTFDGYMLVDVFDEWVDGLVKTGKEPFKWAPDVKIGSGSLEIDSEREHDQSYFVGIDYDRKVIFTNIVEINTDEASIDEFVRRMCGLYKLGWRVRYGTDDDCLYKKVPKGILLMLLKDDIDCEFTLTDKDFDSQKLKKFLVGILDIYNNPVVRLTRQSGQDPSLIINQMIDKLRQKLDKEVK